MRLTNFCRAQFQGRAIFSIVFHSSCNNDTGLERNSFWKHEKHRAHNWSTTESDPKVQSLTRSFFGFLLPCGQGDPVSWFKWKDEWTISIQLKLIGSSFCMWDRWDMGNLQVESLIQNQQKPGRNPPRNPRSPWPGAQRHGQRKKTDHNTVIQHEKMGGP